MTTTATSGELATIQKVRTQRFFTYRQNACASASITYDAEAGISTFVVIQAANAVEANTLMNLMGITFGEFAKDGKCKCAGYLWNALDDDAQGTPGPIVHRKPITEMWMPDQNERMGFRRMDEGEYEVFVHFADGTVRGFCASEEPSTPPPGPDDNSEDSEDGGEDSEASEANSGEGADDLEEWEKELLYGDDQPGEDAKDFDPAKGGGDNPWYDFGKHFAPKG